MSLSPLELRAKDHASPFGIGSLWLGVCLTLLVAGCATRPGRVEKGDVEAITLSGALQVRRVHFRTEFPDFGTVTYSTVANRYLLPIFAANPVEWYCGCRFEPTTKSIPARGCGYAPLPNPRAERIEWEHVVPREWVARQVGCATVASCDTPKFKRAIADPYNLVPAHAALNGKRSNHPYWEIEGERRAFGTCDFEFAQETTASKKSSYVEPPEDKKGDLARIVLYYIDRYKLSTAPEGSLAWLRVWADADPLSEDEAAVLESIRESVADWEASPLDY